MTKETKPMPDSSSSSTPAGGGIWVGLIPWILFTLLAEHESIKLAAILTVVAAIAVCLYSARSGGRPKLIEMAAVVTFIGFTVVAFAADASTTDWLVRYDRAIAAGLLAALVFGSLLFVPFTEEYARQVVPSSVWGSPGFKAANQRLTTMWGLIFTVMTASHIVAGTLDQRRTNILFNWVIPIGLIIWGTKQSRPHTDVQRATTA